MDFVSEKLDPFLMGGTPAERRLARFFMDNMGDLPFETAASIGERLRLSPMTVSRFLRSLGYQGLDAFKADLRVTAPLSAWQLKDTQDTLRRDLGNGQLLAEVITDQITTLHRLYELSKQDTWYRCVERIWRAEEVFVASFQNIGGIARYFSEQLSYARDGVRYMDGGNGTYAELLDRPAEGALLILIDCRRFASKSRILAKAAAEAGHELVIVSDAYRDWSGAGRHTLLTLPPARTRTWDNFMSLAALLDFLVTAVVVEGGDAVRRRTERIGALQNLFGDFEEG